MNSKQLIFLPLLVLGLASCNSNTNPKPLTYSQAISYINKNSKGKPTSCTGNVSYSSKNVPTGTLITVLKYLGVTDTSEKEGRNTIPSESITNYLDNSDAIHTAGEKPELPLMYLNEANFTKFVKGQSGFSYSLTNINEFVMYQITSEDRLYYTRYYDTNLRLYKFEIHSVLPDQEFDLTQIFNTSI